MPGLGRLKSVRVKAFPVGVSKIGCRWRHYRRILRPQQRHSGQIRGSRPKGECRNRCQYAEFPNKQTGKGVQP
jgi:hypothetical protein